MAQSPAKTHTIREPIFLESATEMHPNDVDRETEMAGIVLYFAQYAIDMATTERVPRYPSGRRENNSEHTFMGSMVGIDLTMRLRPDLDCGLVTQYFVVHELGERITGDTATFLLDDSAIAAKEARDHAVRHEVARQLGPYLGGLYLRYEAQIEPEARWTRLVEKLLPVAVDILGQGKRVMSEDFGITTHDEMVEAETRLSLRLRRAFPESELAFVHLVRDMLARQFIGEYT